MRFVVLLVCWCAASLALAEEGDDGSYVPYTPADIMLPHERQPRPQTNEEAVAVVEQALDEVMERQEEALQRMRMGLHGGADQPAEADPSAPGGTLWLFWAADAPQAEELGRMLGEVRVQLPEVAIRPVHVMPLTSWYAWFHQVEDRKEAVFRAAHAGQRDEAQRLASALRANTMALRTVPRFAGRDEVDLFTDVRSAIAFDVQSYPTLIYVSPRSVVHRLVGGGRHVSLPQWIGQCLAYEEELLQEAAP